MCAPNIFAQSAFAVRVASLSCIGLGALDLNECSSWRLLNASRSKSISVIVCFV